MNMSGMNTSSFGINTLVKYAKPNFTNSIERKLQKVARNLWEKYCQERAGVYPRLFSRDEGSMLSFLIGAATQQSWIMNHIHLKIVQFSILNSSST